MSDLNAKKDDQCVPDEADVTAYLDGELSGEACRRFERHLKECQTCSELLAEQRRLLYVLEMTLGEGHEVGLPRNFAQLITARAQSDMSGLRRGAETGRALIMCVLLAAGAFALLGLAMFDAMLGPGRALARSLASVLSVIGHALVDAGTSLAVILRALGGHLLTESRPVGLWAYLLLTGGAAALLLLLVGRSNRIRRPRARVPNP